MASETLPEKQPNSDRTDDQGTSPGQTGKTSHVQVDDRQEGREPHSPVSPSGQDPLSWPATTLKPTRIRWRYAIGIPLIHLLACFAFVPWLFSWTGVVLCVLGLYAFGTLGINLCYHRILTHQGMVAPKWLEHGLAILGVCTLQDSPACWVAMHRMHHKYSDTQPDPHSPWVHFFWGHCGWLMIVNRDFRNVNYYERFVRDILKDPFYLRLERNSCWTFIYAAHALLFLAVGFVIGWASSGSSQSSWTGCSLV